MQIDDEIIRYTRRLHDGFDACLRGAYGTKAAPHAAGAKVHRLKRSYGLFLYDIDSSLMDEVAGNLAGVFNECGFNAVYFDGSEILQDEFHEWYYVAKMQNAFYRRMANRREVLVQGSNYSHLTWHMHVRSASADGAADIKGYLDQRSPRFEWYRRNLMRLELGWYALGTNSLRPDDAEYILCRALGFDASVGWITSVAALDGNPHSDELLELSRRYQRLRLEDAFQGARRRLREPKQNFRLTAEGASRALIPVQYDAPRAIDAFDGRQNVWQVHCDGDSDRQPLEIEVRVTEPVRGESRQAAPRDGGSSRLVISLGDRRLVVDEPLSAGDTVRYRGPDDCRLFTAFEPVSVWAPPARAAQGRHRACRCSGGPLLLARRPNTLRLEWTGPAACGLIVRTSRPYPDRPLRP